MAPASSRSRRFRHRGLRAAVLLAALPFFAAEASTGFGAGRQEKTGRGAGAPVVLRLDRPATVEVPLSSEARDALRARLSAPPPPQIRLSIEGLEVAHDLAVRIFLDLPRATARTPIADPHYAATFTFYAASEPGAPGAARRSFLFDPMRTLKKLAAAPGFAIGPTLPVTLVLAPLRPSSRPADVALSLERVRLVVDAGQPAPPRPLLPRR
jgi:hypothetical protein